MFSPYAVCKQILERGTEVSPIKLIKLAYLSHGFHLAYLDKPIFDDDVEAWPYGPVIRRIYFSVNHYRRKTIRKDFFAHIEDPLDENAIKVINSVMNTYNKYSGLELSALTHMEGSPWDVTVKKEGINTVIPESRIKDHFKGIIHAANTR